MRSLIFLIISAGALCAQMQMPGGGAAARTQPNYEELKTALGLTEDQITQLKQMQQEKVTATQAFYGKMADKQKELSQTLEATPSDPAKVGQLMIDLQTLRKQPPPSGSDVHERAVALLLPEQKEKLAKLEQAQKLRSASDQAVQLALLTPPAPVAHPNPTPGMMPKPCAPKPAMPSPASK